jgi:hypothetical protein
LSGLLELKAMPLPSGHDHSMHGPQANNVVFVSWPAGAQDEADASR